MAVAQIKKWVPKIQGPLVLVLLTLVALPKIRTALRASLNLFKEHCAYHQAPQVKVNKGCGKSKGKTSRKKINLFRMNGHQDTFTNKNPRFSIECNDLTLPHLHLTSCTYQNQKQGRQVGKPYTEAYALGQCSAQQGCTPYERPQPRAIKDEFEAMAPRPYSEAINPRPYSAAINPRHCSNQSCSTPLVERVKPKAFREKLNTGVNFAEPEVTQANRSTSGVQSPLKPKT